VNSPPEGGADDVGHQLEAVVDAEADSALLGAGNVAAVAVRAEVEERRAAQEEEHVVQVEEFERKFPVDNSIFEISLSFPYEILYNSFLYG
jgi:hypothetical protein